MVAITVRVLVRVKVVVRVAVRVTASIFFMVMVVVLVGVRILVKVKVAIVVMVKVRTKIMVEVTIRSGEMKMQDIGKKIAIFNERSDRLRLLSLYDENGDPYTKKTHSGGLVRYKEVEDLIEAFKGFLNSICELYGAIGDDIERPGPTGDLARKVEKVVDRALLRVDAMEGKCEIHQTGPDSAFWTRIIGESQDSS